MIQMSAMGTAIGVPAAKADRDGRRAAYSPLPKWLFPALFAAEILVYWLPRMSRGFWIDEATTYWIDQGGWAQAWPKLRTFPAGQSFLYQFLVAPFMSSGTYQEALLRVPSIAGMLLAAWLLHKLTERILERGSGWLAVSLFACAGAIVETATNARPYALGLAVILTSFWSLRECVHTGKGKWLALYCASSALVVYFHYAFLLIFLVQAVYLIAAYQSGRQSSWWRILGAGFAIVAAAIPLGWQMLRLVQQAHMWTSSAKPSFVDFLTFFPVQVLVVVMLGLVLFFALHREWFEWRRGLATDDLVLLLTWALLGPLVLFVVDRTTSLAIFTTRYLIYALPPCFILMAWFVSQVRKEPARFILGLAVVLNATLYIRGVGADTPEWRTPLRVAQQIAGAGTPIVLRSAHADAIGLDWKTEPNPATHYFAQLAPYPSQNDIIPAPFFMDAAADRYLKQEIQRRAPARFCLVADKGSDVLATLPAWFRSRGYKVETQDVGGIEVLVFSL